MERIHSPQGSKASERKWGLKRSQRAEGWVCSVGVGVGGPCNDLTAVVTFLISARFNYTVDEEGARPPLALALPFLRCFVLSVTTSSSFPHQSLAQTRPVVLTRHWLANKIWLIAPERFLLRSLLPFAVNPLPPPMENFEIFFSNWNAAPLITLPLRNLDSDDFVWSIRQCVINEVCLKMEEAF